LQLLFVLFAGVLVPNQTGAKTYRSQVLSEKERVFAEGDLESSRVVNEPSDTRFLVRNVGKDGTFLEYSCLFTMDLFWFEEIVSRNGPFIL